MMSPLSAVIFDFHGVLTESSLPGLVLPELQDDHEVVTALEQLETGRIAMAEFLAALPTRLPSRRAFRLTVRGRLVERALELRADGWRTALLTNTFRGFARIRARAGVDDAVFDVVVESWRYGMRKPAAELYRLTARLLGTDPGQCAYLDDDADNVAAAAALGMTALLVSDEQGALDWLADRFPPTAAGRATPGGGWR
jgi:HAD superfamily hydrolase (TIGR01509 family)